MTACKYGDEFCPCQDGDSCHYEGMNPMKPPAKTDVRRFIATASKPHAQIAGALADEIKAVIYKHEGMIPLALAIGVLRIVEKELLDDA